MDGIKEMLDRLSELSEGELSDLESKIISEFESVEKQEPTAQVVDQMTALADALDNVRGEQEGRIATQKDLEKRAAEAASRVKGAEAAMSEDDDTEEDEDTEEAPVEEPVAEDEEDEDKKKVPSTFAAEDTEAEVESTDTDEVEAEAETEAEPTEATAEEAETTEPEAAATETEVEAPAEDATSEPEAAAPVPEPESDSATETLVPEVVAEPQSPVPTAQTNEEIPVAASATDVVVTPPADSRPVPRSSATVAITAGADIPGISAGTELSSVREVADAFVRRLHNLSRVSSPNGQQYTVATMTASIPEDRMLHASDGEGNWDKIVKVVSPQAVIAAGSCVPLEIRYDLFGAVGTTDTPVMDSLPTFGADRGGIIFTPSPQLPGNAYSGASGAIGLWNSTDGTVTQVDGTALTTPDEKPCYSIDCPTPTEAQLEAVSMCLCFDNLTSRVYPELISRHNELALVQHARVTEQHILSEIKTVADTTVAAAGDLGAAREILGQVDKVAMVLRYKHRLAPAQPLRVIFPYWLKDMVRADVAFQMPGDGLDETMALADAALDRWFRARNINVTWSMESAFDVAAVPDTFAAITSSEGGFPATIEWDIFAEGTFLVLDGGTLDLGVIRDMSHVKSNSYCEFSEAFYKLVKLGGESVHVTSTLAPTGAAAALVDVLAS